MKGAQVVDYKSDPIKGANQIAPSPDKQAAVTFGAGVTTQELNNALDPSLLFTMGAAHGTCLDVLLILQSLKLDQVRYLLQVVG